MRIVNSIGAKGEELAVKFLQKKGYKILERNYRKRYAEIDIVALQDKTLVFIEVKTRTSQQFGTPLEAITSFKLRLLIQAAAEYSVSHPKLPNNIRIDAVAIELSKDGEGKKKIEHIENITM